MPSEKTNRAAVRKRRRNRVVRTATRTRLVAARADIESGSVEKAAKAVQQAVAALDRAASKGIVHPNKAARGKSRLVRRLNALKAAKAEG